MEPAMHHTKHAVVRRAQRNLTEQDIEFVFEYGRFIRCAGALHVFLCRRDIPSEKELYQRYARLEGTTLVVNDTGRVPVLITTYRNRRAYKGIRSKAKYRR